MRVGVSIQIEPRRPITLRYILDLLSTRLHDECRKAFPLGYTAVIDTIERVVIGLHYEIRVRLTVTEGGDPPDFVSLIKDQVIELLSQEQPAVS